VPIPEPLRFLEPRETETRKMHALEEYGLMHVKLYEDIARNGHIATTYAYPVKVEGRYVMDPSPTPKFDNPKMHMSEALQLFGAGREKRIYAVPPYTEVVSLDFEDYPFEVQQGRQALRAVRRARTVYLDEVILDDKGGRMFVCSDTDYCEKRRAGHGEPWLGEAISTGRHDGGKPNERPEPPLAPLSSGVQTRVYGTGSAARCLLRSVARRGAGHRRRIRFRQDHAAQLHLDAADARPPARSATACATARRDLYQHGRGRAPLADAHRLGLRASEPADGLRMTVSAGANVGERLMAVGERHYGNIREHRDRLARPGRDR
jgi:hypothetical protein